ncbi:MAG: gliding motility-associated C-terminal domain-containing protein, partial [Bacteroidota bacterium]
ACRDGQFVFDRTGLDFSNPLTINFNIDSESSAQNGIDFETIPNQITIPAGERVATLPIQVIPDTIEEFIESLRLELDVPCECETPNFSTLFISDVNEIEVSFDELEVCADQEFSISPTIIGGAAPYEYEWVTGDRSASLTATVDAPRHYEITVTDACGRQGFGLAGIDIQSTPRVEVVEDITYCEGIPAFLSIAFEGNAPWSFSYTIDDEETMEVDNIFDNPYSLPVFRAGEYQILSFRDRFCEGQVAQSGSVLKSGATINYRIQAPSCFDTFDGGISLVTIEGDGPFQIEWTPPISDSLGTNNLQAGTYQLKVTDANGCESTEIIELQPDDANCQEIEIAVPNAFSPNNDGINDRFELFFPQNNPIEQIESLYIFNRWGSKVY